MSHRQQRQRQQQPQPSHRPGSSWYLYRGGVAPKDVTRVQIHDSVTALAPGAFLECEDLLQVQFSKHLTSIPSRAFARCASLSHVTLPPSVTTLGPGAFCGAYALKSIRLSASLQEIGHRCFQDCKSLQQVEFVTPPEKEKGTSALTTIAERAFVNNRSLKRLELPDSVQTLGPGALQGCTRLQQVHLPASLRVLETDTLANCESLTHVTLPPNLVQIQDGALCGCRALASLEIPPHVTWVGVRALESCDSLTTIQWTHVNNLLGSSPVTNNNCSTTNSGGFHALASCPQWNQCLDLTGTAAASIQDMPLEQWPALLQRFGGSNEEDSASPNGPAGLSAKACCTATYTLLRNHYVAALYTCG